MVQHLTRGCVTTQTGGRAGIDTLTLTFDWYLSLELSFDHFRNFWFYGQQMFCLLAGLRQFNREGNKYMDTSISNARTVGCGESSWCNTINVNMGEFQNF